MSPASAQQISQVASRHFGHIEVRETIRATSNETIATCTQGTDKTIFVLHYLRKVPKNIRIQLEFETTQLRNTQSPNVPQVVDASFNEDEVLILAAHDEGVDFVQWVRSGVSPQAMIPVAISLFQSLHELHELGLQHLDVCPENVAIANDGSAKLVRRSYANRLQQVTSIESAFCYSPEQAGAIDRDLSAATDLYSTGIVLFFAIAGQFPFKGNTIGEILLAHMTQPIPSLRARGDMPSALVEIIEKLLKKDPTERYQTAAAVIHDLELLSEALNAGDPDPQIYLGTQDRRESIVEPALIGRKHELQQLKQAIGDAREGGNSLVLVEGVSGSGKSRTIGEFSRYAVENGWVLFRGQCIQETSRKSMAGMQGVVRGFTNHASNTRFANSFRDQFDGEWADLRAYFPELPHGLHGEPPTETARPITEQSSLRSLSSFLNALGTPRQPALVILDDCQWADELTLKVLKHWWRHFAEQPHNVMLVVSFRGDEVDGNSILRRMSPSCTVKLDQLKDNEIREVARSMAGTLPDRALALVVAAAAGSPFMASAVVRGLVESRAIQLRDGVWQICEREFQACQSSSDAGEFLSRRLELLKPGTTELLSAAASLGREFDLNEAAFIVGRDTNSAVKEINEARGRHLLWYRQSSNLYVFSHDKIRAALLERVPPQELRTWHRRMAAFLASQDNQRDADIAYHYHAAGAVRSALPFALRAAELALSICSYGIAKTQFQIAHLALKYASEEQKYAIETKLGQVLMQRGEYDDVEPHFIAAAQYARNDFESAQALGNLAEIQRRKGNIGEAAKTYEESLSILGYRMPKTRIGVVFFLFREASIQLLHTMFPKFFLGKTQRLPNKRERLALSLCSGLSHSHYNGSSGLTVFATHLYSLNFAERFLPSQELAVLYLEHLIGVSMLGFKRRAEAYAERSRQLRSEDFPPLRDGLTAHYLSVAYFCLGNYSLAIEQGYAAIRMLEQVGDYWKIHMTRYQIAAALYHKGYFREAIEECRKNYDSGIEKGDFQASGIILDVWARAKPGDVPDDILATEFARQRDDPQGTCQLLVAQTANLIGQGKLDEAIESAERGTRILIRTGLMNPYPYELFVWGSLALRKKIESLSALEPQQKNRLIRKALRYVRIGLVHAWLQPVDKPRLLRELALLQMMQGRSRRAKRNLEKSIRLAKEQQARYDEAESLRRLGEIERLLDCPTAKIHLDEGIRKLNQLALEHGTDVISRECEDATTISLADRFDTILEVGRKITAALRESDVHQQTRRAAIRLLRSEECVLVRSRSGQFPIVAGPNIAIDSSIVRHAIIENNTIIKTTDDGHSLICSPISVQGEITACLYASHSRIRDLFGPTEKRLADFIATLAGASLENALGYSQLQELNTTLEDRVAERTQAAESRARELAQSNRELEKTANDLRSTEEQLRNAVVEANAASEAKSRFLATMSHEIRTPMNGIMGMAELALATELDATQTKYLKVVKQSGQTLLDLLNEILDLSKIEAGKVEIESVEFDLREVVENATQLFSPAAHGKNLEIVCDLATDLPQRVIGDSNRIRQIIVNLIGNAVKFTQRGEIDITVQRSDDDYLTFAVRDTGIGIACDKQDAIFEAFQQEDSSTTRKYGGTGLGLSICQQLAELMDGEILLQSEQGVGSTFTLRIPLAPVGLELQSDLVDDQLRGHTAILISDRHHSRQATKRMLDCLGLQVMTVDALDDLERDMVEDIDLVLIDEPHANELDTLLDWAPQKTLALTRATDDRDDHHRCIPKPLNLEEVRDTLRTVVDGPKSLPLTSTTGQEDDVTANAPSGGRRILVADDCEVNQQVARGLLEMEGFEVETVSDGEEVVRAMETKHYDIILMDVEMPVMDGMQATREIRKSSDIPILALSAHTVQDLERRCEDIGFSGYVSKPVQPDDLIGKINKLLLLNV